MKKNINNKNSVIDPILNSRFNMDNSFGMSFFAIKFNVGTTEFNHIYTFHIPLVIHLVFILTEYK